jgi:hypothetical protein
MCFKGKWRENEMQGNGDYGKGAKRKWVYQFILHLFKFITALETDAILERCLLAKCPILFPDCPSDSVPVLSTGPISNDGTDPDGCCQPAIVQCKCDPQKCLVPSCPEATERRMTKKGTEIPGQCCDQFECRASAGVFNCIIPYLIIQF